MVINKMKKVCFIMLNFDLVYLPQKIKIHVLKMHRDYAILPEKRF